MKIYVLLADRGAHNPPSGTLSLLNVGWAVTQLRRPMTPPGQGPDPLWVTSPHVVVVFLEAELSMCNRPLTLEVVLLSEDGHIVQIPGPGGAQAVRLEQSIIVPTAPGVPTGFPGHASAMMEMATGLPLSPGIYRWQARLNQREEDDWSAHFFVSTPPVPPTFGFTPSE